MQVYDKLVFFFFDLVPKKKSRHDPKLKFYIITNNKIFTWYPKKNINGTALNKKFM